MENQQHISSALKMFEQADTVLRQWEEGANLNRSLKNYGERSLLTNIIYNIFRHRAVLDWIIDSYVKYKIDAPLRNILRISLCDILYLHGMPAEIIADVAVRFAKQKQSRKKANFINGVIRNILRAGADNCRQQALEKGAPYVRLELSPQLYEKWKDRDDNELKQLAETLKTPAPLFVRTRTHTDPEQVNSFLEEIDSLTWLPPDVQFFRCTDAAALFKSRLFRDNLLYVQDPATLLAPALLNPVPGENIADLCCAPGGKAIFIAEQLQQQGGLLCMDRSETRLKTAAKELSKFPHVSLRQGDAVNPDLPSASFDAVLLDVPCSNTGVIRRRPDVRWNFSQANLKELITLQQRILNAAADLIRPGGRLVYSTCSIEEEENRLQTQNFLEDNRSFEKITDKLLLPTASHDGAYAALLSRTKSG